MLGVSFYIIFRSSAALLPDLDATIKASIENNVLLEVLESLGTFRNCSIRDTVSYIYCSVDWLNRVVALIVCTFIFQLKVVYCF
jgi:hypothetical protein